MAKIRMQWTVNWEREGEAEYLKYIKARIKEAREDAQLTQAELAEKLQRTQTYFSKLETGDLVPSITEILGIAQFTNKPIQFFLPIQDVSEDILTGKEWQLISHFRNIHSEEVKDIALSTVKHFSQMKPNVKKG